MTERSPALVPASWRVWCCEITRSNSTASTTNKLPPIHGHHAKRELHSALSNLDVVISDHVFGSHHRRVLGRRRLSGVFVPYSRRAFIDRAVLLFSRAGSGTYLRGHLH